MRKKDTKGLFMEVIVKNIICIFTIKDGEVYIVLEDNKVPCIVCNNEIDIVNKNYINDLNIDNLDLKQTYTFSEKKDDKLTFYILFNDIVNYDSVKNLNLISLDKVENSKFLSKSVDYLKNNIVINNKLNKVINKEFGLPELQKLLEKVLMKKFDRRNFRKKLLNSNIIEQLDRKDNTNFGRPAKLYKFKENIKDIKIL